MCVCAQVCVHAYTHARERNRERNKQRHTQKIRLGVWVRVLDTSLVLKLIDKWVRREMKAARNEGTHILILVQPIPGLCLCFGTQQPTYEWKKKLETKSQKHLVCDLDTMWLCLGIWLGSGILALPKILEGLNLFPSQSCHFPCELIWAGLWGLPVFCLWCASRWGRPHPGLGS